MAASFRGLLHFAGFFATSAGKSATTQLVDVALVFSQTEIMFAVAESSDVALSGKATGGGGGAVCFYVFLYTFLQRITRCPQCAQPQIAALYSHLSGKRCLVHFEVLLSEHTSPS